MSDPMLESGFDPFSVVTSLGWLVFGPHFHAALFLNPLFSIAALVGWRLLY